MWLGLWEQLSERLWVVCCQIQKSLAWILPWLGCSLEFFASQFQIMQRRIPVRNLLIILAVVAVSFFTLNSGVSVASCSVCDLARLYNGGGFRWSVRYLLLAVIFSGLVTWIPRMIPFILVKYKGLPAIVERF